VNNDPELNALLLRMGDQRIGGMHRAVYRHAKLEEVLKLALTRDPTLVQDARTAFRRALEVSAAYAPVGLMPEVLEFGDDFYGTGYPWLRERYVHGDSLARKYLLDPAGCIELLPEELARIYGIIKAGPVSDVRAMWDDKLQDLAHPDGCEKERAAVRRAGEYLREHHAEGHGIHSDVQFGNMLAVERAGGAENLMLIDWEVSEVMPLSYEFAMLYAFLFDPTAQVPGALVPAYRRQRSLRAVWDAIAPVLWRDLGITVEEFVSAFIFRMGNARLLQIESALARGDSTLAEDCYRDLRAYTSGELLTALPYPKWWLVCVQAEHARS